MDDAPQTNIPDWMRANILNFKGAMCDRVILRAIRQEEILSAALAVHKAQVEGRPLPEIKDGVVRDMAGGLGYWLDLKLKTDNVGRDRTYNRRFAGEVSHDLHAIELNQRIRDRLGLPVTAGLREVDQVLAAMPHVELLKVLDEDGKSGRPADTFAITALIRRDALNGHAHRPGLATSAREPVAPQAALT
jgi:hypothetical protein